MIFLFFSKESSQVLKAVLNVFFWIIIYCVAHKLNSSEHCTFYLSNKHSYNSCLPIHQSKLIFPLAYEFTHSHFSAGYTPYNSQLAYHPTEENYCLKKLNYHLIFSYNRRNLPFYVEVLSTLAKSKGNFATNANQQ